MYTRKSAYLIDMLTAMNALSGFAQCKDPNYQGKSLESLCGGLVVSDRVCFTTFDPAVTEKLQHLEIIWLLSRHWTFVEWLPFADKAVTNWNDAFTNFEVRTLSDSQFQHTLLQSVAWFSKARQYVEPDCDGDLADSIDMRRANLIPDVKYRLIDLHSRLQNTAQYLDLDAFSYAYVISQKSPVNKIREVSEYARLSLVTYSTHPIRSPKNGSLLALRDIVGSLVPDAFSAQGEGLDEFGRLVSEARRSWFHHRLDEFPDITDPKELSLYLMRYGEFCKDLGVVGEPTTKGLHPIIRWSIKTATNKFGPKDVGLIADLHEHLPFMTKMKRSLGRTLESATMRQEAILLKLLEYPRTAELIACISEGKY